VGAAGGGARGGGGGGGGGDEEYVPFPAFVYPDSAGDEVGGGVEEAVARGDKTFCCFTQRDPAVEQTGRADLFTVCTARRHQEGSPHTDDGLDRSRTRWERMVFAVEQTEP